MSALWKRSQPWLPGEKFFACRRARDDRSLADIVDVLARLEALQLCFDRVRDLLEALHRRTMIRCRQDERTRHFRLDK